MSANSTGYWKSAGLKETKYVEVSGNIKMAHRSDFGVGVQNFQNTPLSTGFSINVSHTHTVIADGTVSSSFSGTDGTTGSATPTFTGTAGTTGSSGSGTSFSILPPYVVKYCFERTA